ncbi:MAG: SUMF1/EgtB/PvdO family nonheme iron enzyme [Methylococcaceae bacterium]
MQQQSKNTCLAPDTLVDYYEIRGTLNVDIFGFTYKAWDSKHSRLVVLKEYFPTDIAVRIGNSNSIEVDKSNTDDFQYGLNQFLDEANTLTKFHHPNIVTVHNRIQANNTSYLCMALPHGQTLAKKLVEQGGTLPEKDLIPIVNAMVSALQYSHGKNHLHANISPENIFLRDSSSPALINFAVARRAIAVQLKKLPNINSSGYTSYEQYEYNLDKQGAWSDFYALGATLYRCISGKTPVNAKTRYTKVFKKKLPDPLIPALTLGQGVYSKDLLALIDWMLAPTSTDRPQNTAEIISKIDQNPSVFGPKTPVDADIFSHHLASPLISKTKQASSKTTLKESVIQQPVPKPLLINNQENSETVQQEVKVIPQKQPLESESEPEQQAFISNSDLIIVAPPSSETDQQKNLTTIEKPYISDLFAESADNESSSKELKYWLAFISFCIIIAIISISQKQNLQRLIGYIADETPITTAKKTGQENKDQVTPRANNKKQPAVIEHKQQNISKKLQTKKSPEIQTILSKAAANIKQMRLSTPAGNNALEKYQHVLQLQPNNKEARQGLIDISDQYLLLSNKLLKQQSYSKARLYLNKAKAIQPSNPKVIETEDKINAVEKNSSKKYPSILRVKPEKFSFDIDMVWVVPGCFQMGDNEIYATEHQVCLTSGYFIGKYEVTQKQWLQVMKDNPSTFKRKNNPVENVSWNEVQTFIYKLNNLSNQKYRLPTEAEWEYACLFNGTTQKFCGSDNADKVAWHKDNSDNSVHPVGQKKANHLGLYDMSGNVWEWVQDWYSSDYYSVSRVNNPRGPSESSGHVVRGGSWFSGNDVLRSAYRVWYGPNVRVSYLGFRLVKSK